jgi:hypothetical protein
LINEDDLDLEENDLCFQLGNPVEIENIDPIDNSQIPYSEALNDLKKYQSQMRSTLKFLKTSDTSSSKSSSNSFELEIECVKKIIIIL